MLEDAIVWLAPRGHYGSRTRRYAAAERLRSCVNETIQAEQHVHYSIPCSSSDDHLETTVLVRLKAYDYELWDDVQRHHVSEASTEYGETENTYILETLL